MTTCLPMPAPSPKSAHPSITVSMATSNARSQDNATNKPNARVTILKTVPSSSAAFACDSSEFSSALSFGSSRINAVKSCDFPPGIRPKSIFLVLMPCVSLPAFKRSAKKSKTMTRSTLSTVTTKALITSVSSGVTDLTGAKNNCIAQLDAFFKHQLMDIANVWMMIEWTELKSARDFRRIKMYIERAKTQHPAPAKLVLTSDHSIPVIRPCSGGSLPSSKIWQNN
mmetsp:Transcript_145286/g.465488  ORF Transcript_145286/g.465488 Transcript_145286/m.465488 type:complete len:226 (+) Transcript_145286:281-958(+)